MIPFDHGFAAQSAEEFVRARCWSTGSAPSRCRWARTSASARARRATPEFLRSHDEFETRVVPLVEVAGETVSSSHIRGLVAAGEVEQAAEFLGGPFLFEGEVVQRRPARPRARHADRQPRARRRATSCPGHGVYAAWAHGHPAAVNVGVRPTFETGRGLLVEAHLIDFDGDLYGADAADRLPGAPARREALRLGGRAGGADEPRRAPRRARSAPIAAATVSALDDADRGAEARDRGQARPRRRRTPARPRSRSRCSPRASTSSPSTCASTARTTTRAAAC